MSSMAPQKTVEELEKEEIDAFQKGPLSVLTTSVKTNCQVLETDTSTSWSSIDV